jgi:DNA helicase HerA-like ATPase
VQSKLPYEKLGLLYLGKELEIDSRAGSSMPLLYKSKNLTTHGVIIGMTGSGKTGLGVGLIEEAIMDDIPSIIIDPKGDMANLALSFPDLAPADFKPWVDPAEASRKNLSVDALAEKTARDWREGLAAWGQDGERIGELRRKSRLTV